MIPRGAILAGARHLQTPRMVALEGEQVIGFVFNDLVGDRNLAAHGGDGHQCSLELIGFRQVVEELRDSGDFIGLLGHAELAQDQPVTSRALLAQALSV